MSDVVELARKLRPLIEKAAESLSDEDASKGSALFPILKYDGSLIEAFTRINWRGEVMKSAAALWDTVENDPDHAPNLWTHLPYRDGIRIIPEVIYLADAFEKDELGWWGDVIYRSKVDNNVYTPEQYPGNWEVWT